MDGYKGCKGDGQSDDDRNCEGSRQLERTLKASRAQKKIYIYIHHGNCNIIKSKLYVSIILEYIYKKINKYTKKNTECFRWANYKIEKYTYYSN